jgi:hypothetical protein
VKVPTLALYSGRALQKLGRLIEAAEFFLQATQLEPTGATKDAQVEAQREANQEREALLPRIPRLMLRLEGATLDEVTLEVDSVALPTSLAEEGRLVDPGEHVVQAKRGDQVVTESVRVVEGERRTVGLRFPRASSGPAPGTGPEPAAPARPPAGARPTHRATQDKASTPTPFAPRKRGKGSVETDRAAGSRSALRTLGWVGVGLGAAGVVAGAVSGLIALSQKKELDNGGCDAYGRCYWDQDDQVSDYNTMRFLSTIGLVGGGVALAGGITLLVAVPAPQHASYPVRAWVGLGSVGLDGRF